MSIATRRLAPSDLSPYRGCMALFACAFDDSAHYASAPPADAYVTTLLANPAFMLLAALEGDSIIGALAAYVLPKFEQARSEIYIYDLAVAEQHRRRGAATALIEHLKGEARAVGASVIYVQADYGDEPAIALYEKLGTREDVMHFDIDPYA